MEEIIKMDGMQKTSFKLGGLHAWRRRCRRCVY